MNKKVMSLFFICSLFFVSLAFALDIPEEIPENISEEMIGELPDEYLTPELYDELLVNMTDSYCVLIEPYLSNIIGQEIPEQIPFTTETFSLYVAEEPIASLSIKDKVVENLLCGEISEDTTYNIYISSLSIISDISEDMNPIDFYKEKRKSGEIKIKAVGFGRSIKLFFLNIGIDIASWFI